MRAPLVIVAFGCTILVGAAPAGADPQPSSSPKAGSSDRSRADDQKSTTDSAPPGQAEARDRSSSTAKPDLLVPDKLPRSGVALLLPGLSTVPGKSTADDNPIDLFPPDLLGGRGTFRPFTHGDKERRAGIPLGDDRDWKVQAAQIGVMAGAFAALVGLCGSGRCMLPESSASWLPGFLQPQGQIIPETTREPEIRQAR